MKFNIALGCVLAMFSTTACVADNVVVHANVDLRDGSRLRGEFKTDAFSVGTIFDSDLELSAGIVRSVTFGDDSKGAKFVLVNGDILNSSLKNESIAIDTCVGSLVVPVDKVKSLGLSQQKSLKQLKPGVDYCVIDLSPGHQGTFPVYYTSELPAGDSAKLSMIVLKRISPGEFKMCNRAKVCITKPYYIGVYEITQSQYELITGKRIKEWGSVKPEVSNAMAAAFHLSYNNLRGSEKGSRWPQSSDVDDDSFIGRLRKATGLACLDLPTEAQWEYACRAGTTSLYNNGGNSASDLNKLGRYGGNSKDGKCGGKFWVDVGSYEPNAWGLYDMHGNVFEWCLDWNWPLHDCADPVGGETGRNRCLRGGCVDYRADECTQDFRYYAYGYPSNESNYFGARICLPAEK